MLSTKQLQSIRIEVSRQIKGGNSLDGIKKVLVGAQYSQEEICEVCSVFESEDCGTYCDMKAREMKNNLHNKRRYMLCSALI